MIRKKIENSALPIVLVAILLAGLLFGVFTSVKHNDTEKTDKDAQKKVEKAFENLKKFDKTYEVSNVMQAPDGNLCYVEICSNGVSYSEYPLDANGNYGTVAFQNSNEDVDYVLTDWVTADGKGYMMKDENTWIKYPSNYSKKLQSRNIMYLDTIVKNIKSLKLKESSTVDIGMGDEDMDIYTGTLDSDIVRKIVCLGSEEIYTDIKNTTKDKNIKKLCGFYLDDIGFTMVFSDAKVTIGVVDDMIRYVQLEIGGLGSRLYITKSILTKDVELRQEPDFSNAVSYESTMKDLADYVSKYDNYEEAMQALNTDSSTEETTETTTEETSEESTETSSEETTETTEDK